MLLLVQYSIETNWTWWTPLWCWINCLITKEGILAGGSKGVQGSITVSRRPGGRGVSAALQHCPTCPEKRSYLRWTHQWRGCCYLYQKGDLYLFLVENLSLTATSIIRFENKILLKYFSYFAFSRLFLRTTKLWRRCPRQLRKMFYSVILMKTKDPTSLMPCSPTLPSLEKLSSPKEMRETISIS